MSFIRPLNDGPKWVDEAITEGLYVYGDGERIRYMPTTHHEFAEVVVRMLEQSDVLDEDELEKVVEAFAVRFGFKQKDYSRNITQSDAAWGVLDAYTFCKENGHDDLKDELESIWETLEHDDL